MYEIDVAVSVELDDNGWERMMMNFVYRLLKRLMLLWVMSSPMEDARMREREIGRGRTGDRGNGNERRSGVVDNRGKILEREMQAHYKRKDVVDRYRCIYGEEKWKFRFEREVSEYLYFLKTWPFWYVMILMPFYFYPQLLFSFHFV